MCALYLQTLGVQAFPGLRTGRDLAQTGHHVSRGHHVQSESLTVRTSGCIAIDSVVDPRWHGLRTSTSGRIAFNAVGMDMDMDWIFIYFPPTSLISTTNIYIYRLPVRTASRLCQLWRLPSKWRIWIIKFLWIFAASNGIHLYLKKRMSIYKYISIIILQRIPGPVLDEIDEENTSRTYHSYDETLQRWFPTCFVRNHNEVRVRYSMNP